MISAFLHSCIAQVRTLVREGKALHVSDQTADELELVAGLFKEPVQYEHPPTTGRLTAETNLATLPRSELIEVTLADIAWAWLKLAYVEPGCVTDSLWERGEWAKRAAECAELATIASRIDVPNGQSIELDGEELRLCSPVNPHEGTRGGARAALWFIGTQLEEMRQTGLLATGQEPTHKGARIGEVAERYRRATEHLEKQKQGLL